MLFQFRMYNKYVCFLTGNADNLGTELLENLLKMAPTKEEERKLKEYEDDSPFKLGTAEKFLKAVLDIPFAFKRVEAMLYISNFDSEVEYLKKSFETLEVIFYIIHSLQIGYAHVLGFRIFMSVQRIAITLAMRFFSYDIYIYITSYS